jgi:putative flippase GtrA
VEDLVTGAVRLQAIRLFAPEKVRYLLVGAWNTLLGYLLFAALVIGFGDTVHYTLLLLVSHVITVLEAFVAYRYLVFRVRGNVLLDLFRFWSVYAAALVVNLVALPLLVDVVGLPVLPAQAGLVVATIVTTYVVNRRFSFRRPAAPAQGVRSTTAI